MRQIITEDVQFSEEWKKALKIFEQYTTEEEGTFELGKRTAKNYLQQLKHFIKFVGFKQPQDVRAFDLKSYVLDLRRKGRKQNYVAFAVAAIKCAFDIWLELGLIEDKSILEYRLNTRRRKGKRRSRNIIKSKSLTAEALLKIFDTIEKSDNKWDVHYKDRDWLIFALGYVTGLRAFELENIIIKNIDFDRKMITVIRKGDELDHVLITDLLKVPYKHRDQIPDIMEKLKAYIEKRDLKDDDALFGIKAKAIWYRIKHWIHKAELGEKISTHFLRHTFGTHLGALNVSAFTLQTLMNHKNILTTQKYIKLQHTDSSEILGNLGLFSGKIDQKNSILE